MSDNVIEQWEQGASIPPPPLPAPDEGGTPDVTPPPAPLAEPADISAAFDLLKPVMPPVSEGAGVEPQAGPVAAPPTGGPANQPAPGTGAGTEPAAPGPAGPVESGAGEPGPTLEDYSTFRADTNTGILAQAEADIRAEMVQKKIGRITPTNLKAQDDRGNVFWNNPEQPSRPFQTRAEADAWCASRDREIQSIYQTRVRQRAGELAQIVEPYVKMHEFVPTFRGMNTAEKQLFEPLVEPYEITGDDGEILGYTCDLDAMLRAVRSQLSNMQAQYKASHPVAAGEPGAAPTGQAAPAAAPATRPAMAMPSGQGQATSPAANNEPKDINEAYKMLNLMQAEKGKK